MTLNFQKALLVNSGTAAPSSPVKQRIYVEYSDHAVKMCQCCLGYARNAMTTIKKDKKDDKERRQKDDKKEDATGGAPAVNASAWYGARGLVKLIRWWKYRSETQSDILYHSQKHFSN